MGFCKYSFLPEARDIDKWALSVLFSFANLAGVGYKTAMGMGQVHTTWVPRLEQIAKFLTSEKAKREAGLGENEELQAIARN